MMVNLFMATTFLRGMMLLCGVAFLVVVGCVSAPEPIDNLQSKPVDVKTQQRYYDLGLQQYSSENYGEAKEAFQQVIEYGPNTVLGMKAQENLKKIERILKTLEEIEAK